MSVDYGPSYYSYLVNQVSLSNTIRQLWVDYVSWTTALAYTVLFGTGDLNATRTRLTRTMEELATLFEQFYGKEAGDKLRANFAQYEMELTKLVQAYSRGDPSDIADRRQALYRLADEFSLLLSHINPYWDRATIQVMLYEIINSTEEEILRIMQREYAKSIDAHDSLMDQAYRISDEFVSGLQRQFHL